MYIFGYGSLMNEASRLLTGHTSCAIPAIAHGLVRSWSKIDESYKVAPLAVVKGEGQVNGVLLEVDDNALNEFDIREAGYRRIKLSAEQLETEGHVDRSKAIWVYVVDETNAPCHNSPIVMSYVDTVLAGCLEISEAFARHFVEHTQGWHYPLKNDRNEPIYKRMAGVTPSHQSQIDQLIPCRVNG